jgi:hypothetical protein
MVFVQTKKVFSNRLVFKVYISNPFFAETRFANKAFVENIIARTSNLNQRCFFFRIE